MKNMEFFHLNNNITGGGYWRSYHLASRSWSAQRYCWVEEEEDIFVRRAITNIVDNYHGWDEIWIYLFKQTKLRVHQILPRRTSLIWMPSGSERRRQNGGTVMGTIDDLSDDEKTRAFLQLLEYKLRMEKEQVCWSWPFGLKLIKCPYLCLPSFYGMKTISSFSRLKMRKLVSRRIQAFTNYGKGFLLIRLTLSGNFSFWLRLST